MPALEVLHSIPLHGDPEALATDLETIVLAGVDATGERAEVVLAQADWFTSIPAPTQNYGVATDLAERTIG